MKKSITFLLFLIAGTSVAQKGVKQSIAFEKPPVIDGKMEDWTAEWWLDPDGKFLSNVGNDAENLYIRLKIADDVTQEKIGLFGMSLRLSPNSKKKGKVGLRYPVGKDASELKKKGDEDEDKKADFSIAARVQHKKDLLADVEVLELIGLAKENIVSSRAGLVNGIEVIIVAQEDGSYIYECKIPFKSLRLDKSKMETLGVEFQTGRLVQKNNNITPNSGYAPSYNRPGGMYNQQPVYTGSNYAYNPLASPSYLTLLIKLN